ncbi:MAG: DNA mismatch repair protein MutS [Chlamydiae bacterium]|nr:DNA mismatch repair protein MutS [Chlamydiota bacterium]
MSQEILEKNLTPMMEQWASCKKIAKEALLFFRLGDFYEAFHDDAVVIARELELTLTKRQGVPMCGVPWHAAENYIDRLVAKGYPVAIADQVEDPKQAKGLVKRAVTRFVTPGTVINSSLLSEKTNNYLVSFAQVGAVFGLATLDLTTGEFKVTEIENERELKSEIYRLRPAELLTSEKFQKKHEKLFEEAKESFRVLLSCGQEWSFDHKHAYAFLVDHFQVHHLDGFGLKGMVAAINAAGALLAYVQEELSLPVTHIRTIKAYSTADTLSIDWVSQRNLELFETLHGDQTLLKVIDRTQTPMGGRELRQWLKHPLLSVQEITKRQDGIEALTFAPTALAKLRGGLRGVRDLERLMMKVTAGFATPRDLVALSSSLKQVAPIKEIICQIGSALIYECSEQLTDMKELVELLERALVDEPPLRLTDGHIFRDGFYPSLDELRTITKNGREWIARYQNQIREEYGIKTLKVGFNKIFGYYIEVSRGQAHLMPDIFQRRQTLVNNERFISPELKEYEGKVLTAQDRMETMESDLFLKLRQKIAESAEPVCKIARSLATIDTLSSLAEIARAHDYVRPVVDESEKLEIVEGRHPIVELSLPKEQFIPNDIQLDGEKELLMLITGPNMAGKSTYIRQVAMIVIMAQMGAFIPARKGHIGIVDKIFTRIGASDDLSRGQSTFMVEMSETANILNNATSRSLVILDEIGRGTSTYDGVAIAWAVAEYLLKTDGRQAKTLFATHYFELTGLEKMIDGAVNYHAGVKEWNDEIIFLHKIERGAADRSYGIHVARLAGLPAPVITRARQILGELEQDGGRKSNKRKVLQAVEKQLLLFES